MAYKFQDGTFEFAGQLTSSVGLSGSVISADHFLGNASLLAGIVANPMGEALAMGTNNITGVGIIEADTIQTSVDGDGLNINFDGNTGTSLITLKNGVADALSITDGSADFMIFDTATDDNIEFKKNVTFNGVTIADLGTVTTCNIDGGAIDGTTIGANSAGAGTFTTCDATTDFTIGGLVITDNTITDDGTLVIAATTATSFSDGNITNVGDINCDSISVDAAGSGLNIDYSGGDTGTNLITIADSLADALSIVDNENDWMVFNTSDDVLQIGFAAGNIESAGKHHFEAGMTFNSVNTGSVGASPGVARINPSQGTAQYVLVSGSTAQTLRLPEIKNIGAASGEKGYQYFIKRAYGVADDGSIKPSTVDLTISCSAADEIDGESTITLESPGASVMLFGTGSIWHVF